VSGYQTFVRIRQTFVRIREQVHLNMVGLHVDRTPGLTIDRLATYHAAVGARIVDLGEAAARAAKLLTDTVARRLRLSPSGCLMTS